MLSENIQAVYGRISRAAISAGRRPEEIRLVAVTKTVKAETIRESVEIGLREFGENRVQEARGKISILKSQISNSDIKWHLVGHLQKNKAKTAVELFEMIHSVDSAELAQALNDRAKNIGKIQKVLLQVKISDENTKHGISERHLPDLAETTARMENLKTEGLMTIPPLFDNPEKARPFFCKLRELRDKLCAGGYKLKELSMGMSNDFEIAIEEGATIIRVGTSIFGERRRQAI